MPPVRLTEAELAHHLARLPRWTRVGDQLHREFRFASFVDAFGWMTKVALVAERLGHHPEWANVYGRVTVDLTTHDAGGLTANDVELATAMDELAASRG